jgi:uncharacterized protein (DUF1499 family)
MLAITEREPAASRWASRAALFSFGLILTAAFLHRVIGMPTPIAFNLVAVGLAIAGLSIVCALVAAAVIWHTGRPGTARVLFAISLSLVILTAPLLFLVWLRDYPRVSDVTTDFANPPAFSAVARLRGPGSNALAYPRRFADEQARAYPDIRPMVVARSSEEVYALVIDAVKRLHMEIEREEAPDDEAGTPGMIEAVDRTLIMGFYDDVAIRVGGDGEQSRVDIRSAARFGRGDMGRNAERVRVLMKEIQARLDSTVPTAQDARQSAKQRAGTKQEKAGGPRSESRRKSRDRGQ